MRRFRDSSVSSGVREWFTDSEFENSMDDLRTHLVMTSSRPVKALTSTWYFCASTR
jgi:hypothetical protein